MILVIYCKCLIAAMLQLLCMLGTVNRPLYPRAIIEPVQQINMGIVTVFFIIILSITGLKYKLKQIKFVSIYIYL